MTDFADFLSDIGIVGFPLMTIIVFAILCWAMVSYSRIRHGRKGLVESFVDLVKEILSIFKTFWGERKSEDPVEIANRRTAILLFLGFIILMILYIVAFVFSPQSLLALKQAKSICTYILGYLVVIVLTILGSGAFVMKLQARKDAANQ